MIYFMFISTYFSDSRQRKLRMNRKDQFKILIGKVNPRDIGEMEDLFCLNVRCVPSHIYESIPIDGVVTKRMPSGRNEHSVYRTTSFKIRGPEQVVEIIKLLNEAYEAG
jgi:hypothetical protein